MKRPERVLLPEEGSRILVIPDCHYPNMDAASIQLMMEAATDCKVNKAIQLGDLYDFYSISRWEKDPTMSVDIGSLDDEIQSGYVLTDWLNGLKDGWIYLEGNHELRYTALINKYAGLRNTGHTLEKLLGPRVLKNCTFLSHDIRLILNPDTVMEHGHQVSRSLRPKAEYCVLDDYPEQTTIIGHTHKVYTAIKTVHVRGNPVLRRVFSVGHLSDENKQNYVSDPKWQEGFMIITCYKDNMKKSRYDYHQVVIEKDESGRPSFTLWGKVYK